MTTWTQSFNLNVRARFPALTWRRQKEAENLPSEREKSLLDHLDLFLPVQLEREKKRVFIKK